jgi:hypothetical protein
VSDLRRGSQRPTLLHEPPDAVDWTLSDIAVEFADSIGIVLDEWQIWLTRWAFARRSDGLWAARDIGVEVPRQSGKNIWLEVVQLAGVFLFGDRLIIHSAHRADISHEHFVSMRSHIQECDDLMDAMPTGRPNNGFITTNGNESIELDNGARILFKARAKASGRGPRPQKLVMDEALVLENSQVGTIAPGISAQRNPQIIFASSSPMADSEVLHGLRRRAEEPEVGDRLLYAAWNNPPDVETTDKDAWYRVNPSLGYGRITEDSLMGNRKLMSEATFRREHLGVPEAPITDADLQPIPDDVWAALVDESSAVLSHRQVALDVSPDRKWGSIAVSGRRGDGRLHGSVEHRQPGTAWVLDRCQASWVYAADPIRIDKNSPAAAFIAPLRERGVGVVEVSTAEHAQAVGQLLDAVANDGFRHLGGSALTTAVRGAVLRSSGDVELWARRSSRADISPLVALTLAVGGVPAGGGPSIYETRGIRSVG